MNKYDTIAAHPEFPWLAVGEGRAVERLLADRGWLEPGERVNNCQAAGEGNMNLTLRVETDRRTFIVKQARPWVEKYDHIAAPWDRAEVEQRFYARVANLAEVAARMPRLLAADARAKTMLLEDLGPSGDRTSLYAGETLTAHEIAQLAQYAAALHAATRGTDLASFENRAMRVLNHQHIYELPLVASQQIELERFEPGLTAVAAELSQDEAFGAIVRQTGRRYLADGDTLLHGDFFPGSWLRTDDGLKVIDPEFCFGGDAEFDLGIALAHFAIAESSIAAARQLLQGYEMSAAGIEIDARLLAHYAACEVMRRLIGVAQLRLPPTVGRRAAMLRRVRNAALEGRWEKLWD